MAQETRNAYGEKLAQLIQEMKTSSYWMLT